MPRGPRIAYENAFFHVFNRGIAKQRIFFTTSDYQFFLRKLSELKTKKGFDHSIYAYVLMPNHFHLLIQIRATPLAKLMASLMTSFSMYINKSHGRVGILFQNRFKSKLVHRDNYFLGASRYIHLNPIEAGLTKKLLAYRWSSYQELFGSTPTAILDKNEVNRLIGETAKEKLQYHQFLLDGIKRLEELHKAYGFEKDIEGESRFATLVQKKYFRRKAKKLRTI